jgi:[NiFe] hydrogenase assembly HybE family chaperone
MDRPGVIDGATGALVEAYRRIGEERMRGLPFYNPRLSVEAVGFREWAGRGLGVLVAPWLMSLVVLPGPADDWSALPPGRQQGWELPAGRYELTLARPEGIPPHFALALFTTVTDFPDQETARAVALEVLDRLLHPEEAREDGAEGRPPEGSPGVSRRGLLRGIVGLP